MLHLNTPPRPPRKKTDAHRYAPGLIKKTVRTAT